MHNTNSHDSGAGGRATTPFALLVRFGSGFLERVSSCPQEGKIHWPLHARICSIRRLQTILRTQTLVDLRVVVMSIHLRLK
jgi:hypothetical protein